MLRYLPVPLSALLLVSASLCAASDYAREKRWESEITPILDLYGARDLPQVLASAARRYLSLAGNKQSKQVQISDANHFFAGREDEMVKAVKIFLDGVK